MFRPDYLKKGDTIAVIAPSSPIAPDLVQKTAKALEGFGLNTIVMKSCYSVGTDGLTYLAGDDALRAKDFNDAFKNKNVDGVFCVRGGYGAQRIIDKIDFGFIRRNPKPFFGYSDVTALHIVINERCRFVTYHSPMFEISGGLDEYTRACFLGAVFGEGRDGTPWFFENADGVPIKTLVGGRCRGVLTGGNLSLVASSIGTGYEINTGGKILFLEETDEPPYRIDRMLLQLKNSGKLRSCAGIILGSFNKCDGAEDVFKAILGGEGKPCVYNVACGHTMPTMTLPLGETVELDAEAGRFCCVL